MLALKVCDKACGSGHFLIAAAHRIARRLAAVRTGEDEPPPSALRHALRNVIGRCIYGVDINPMAVELCKFALWLEAVEPGKPLSFLDHHIQCGNSLIGATPALIQNGIPDEAFDAIEGDEKEACRKLRKRNQGEREGLGGLFTLHDAENQQALVQVASTVNNLPDESVADVQRKEQAFQQAHSSYDFMKAVDVANLWCAAFVIRKTIPSGTTQPFGVTTRHLMDFAQGGRVPEGVLPESKRLAKQYQFFHWHLAFPDVFKVPTASTPQNVLSGWDGGFDVLLGNPPWERVKLQEKEWFAERRPDIASASNAAARKRLIEALPTSDPALFRQFAQDVRQTDGESQLLRNSGLYPLCGRGDINLYAVFVEVMRNHLSPTGRVGCVLPSEIGTADTTKLFLQDLVRAGSLVSLFSFENEEFLFAGVHHAVKFCLLTLTGRAAPTAKSDFIFYARQTAHLNDKDRRFTLTASDIALINPNTLTCPVFRTGRDAELAKSIYRRLPVLVREGDEESNIWNLTIRRVFDMNKQDTLKLCTQDSTQGHSVGFVPMFEAKLLHQYDHRYASYTGEEAEPLPNPEKVRPSLRVNPRYWLRRASVCERLPEEWKRHWLLVWRDITNTTNEHTVIASILPFVGTDFTLRVGFPLVAEFSALLVANLNCSAFEYCARQSLGGTHLSDYILKQLPVTPPTAFAQACAWAGQRETIKNWLLPRVLELTYTAWDLEAFARDCGYDGPPFRWEEERRFLLRCELDAAFFHLYGITRDDAAYILDTFPIVKRKDEAKWGTYRTKDTIMEIYAALAESQHTGQPYQTRLNPPPADPRCCHPLTK